MPPFTAMRRGLRHDDAQRPLARRGCQSRGLRCGMPSIQPRRSSPRRHRAELRPPLLHAGPGSAVLGASRSGARRGWARSASSAPTGTSSGRRRFPLWAPARPLHINHEIHPCIVGDRVAVGRNACVHACTVGSDVVIGDDVVILDGAVVEDNVVLEPGSTVFPNKRVPAAPSMPAARPSRFGRWVRASWPSGADDEHAAPETASLAPRPAASAAGSDVHASVFIASTASVTGPHGRGGGRQRLVQQHLDAERPPSRSGRAPTSRTTPSIRCALRRASASAAPPPSATT